MTNITEKLNHSENVITNKQISVVLLKCSVHQ